MNVSAKLLQTALDHHQAGRFDDAERVCCDLLSSESTNLDGLRLLGGLCLRKGQMARAIDCLRQAAEQLPEDVEVLTNLGTALRKAGQSDEALTRYRQALTVDPDSSYALSHLGDYFYEASRPAEASEAYGRVVSLCPGNAVACFKYGNGLFATGRLDKAVAAYVQALKIKPDYLEALVNLGMTLTQMGMEAQSKKWLSLAESLLRARVDAEPGNVVLLNAYGNVLLWLGKIEDAVVQHRKALQIAPDFADATANLATGLRNLNRREEALEVSRRALRLMPNSADARTNFGVLYQEMANHEDALAAFDEALRINPSSLFAQWNKALSLLALGRYKEGWRLYESGLGIASMRTGAAALDRRWNGEALKNKRLLIRCEQGLGDNLQFIRYAEMCKAKGLAVAVLAPQPLHGLFSNCPHIDSLHASVGDSDFDVEIPIMSLPFAFGTEVHTIPARVPYLQVGSSVRAAWNEKFVDADGLKVGLVWAGNPREGQIGAHLTDKRRSMDLETLWPLFSIGGVRFYNLQMGEKAKQLNACELKDRIIDLMPLVKDFEDTAAIIERLDLVISVDTSVAHLAGGLGKPVWVLSRFDACWRWLRNRPDNPWYPTARVFGQPKPGDWESVMGTVAEALRREVSRYTNRRMK